MWGAPRKDLSGPEKLCCYRALLLMNGVGGGEVGGHRVGWGRGAGDYGVHRGSC